jgi:hypothetical protein
MAMRSLTEFNATILKRIVNIFCRVNVGAAGAVTLQKWSYPTSLASKAVGSYVSAPTTGIGYAVGNAEGVRSVVRNGTGDWTITLSDSYQRMVGWGVDFVAVAGAPAAPFVGLSTTTTDVTVATAVGNGGLLRFTFQASAGGGALDPASGEKVEFNLTLHDGTSP